MTEFIILDGKNSLELLNSPLIEKKRETTMDFATNIEKVREVIFDLVNGVL